MAKYRIFVLITVLAGVATGHADSNRYRPMAESMFDMMDAFSSTFQKRQGRDSDRSYEGAHGSSSWLSESSPWGMSGIPSPQGSMPWGMGGIPMSPGNMTNLPFFSGYPSQGLSAFDKWRPFSSHQGPSSPTAELDGDWQGRSGELFSVRNGRFRIYLSPNRFQDGYLKLRGNRILTMQTRRGERELSYEYAIQDSRLVLRDEFQNLLLYRRIKRPAYSR